MSVEELVPLASVNLFGPGDLGLEPRPSDSPQRTVFKLRRTVVVLSVVVVAAGELFGDVMFLHRYCPRIALFPPVCGIIRS